MPMMLLGGTFPAHSQQDMRNTDIIRGDQTTLCESETMPADGDQRTLLECDDPASAIGQIPVRIRLNRFDPIRKKRHMYYA